MCIYIYVLYSITSPLDSSPSPNPHVVLDNILQGVISGLLSCYSRCLKTGYPKNSSKSHTPRGDHSFFTAEILMI